MRRTPPAGGPPASLLGTSVIAAVGSLPLHLLPLSIAAAALDARVAVADAGWIATALLCGQLTAALALPLLAVGALPRAAAGGLAVAMLLGLVVSDRGGLAPLLAGWAVVGACAGAFQYLGAVVAAAHRRPRLAFVLRLGLVLVLAGGASGVLRAAGAAGSYSALVATLGAVFGLLLLAGLVLFRPAAHPPPVVDPARPPARGAAGLAIVFVLFVGQTGVLAYAALGATARGLAADEAVAAFALAKMAAGALLLAGLRWQREGAPARFGPLGLLLGAAVVALAAVTDVRLFFGALLLFELTFNALSARLQALLAALNPQLAGRWLTAVILLGAASGPPLHGALIGAGAAPWFTAFAVAAALLPALTGLAAGARARAAARPGAGIAPE